MVTGDEGFLEGAKETADLALKNGDIQIPLGSIQGSKWNDANANGIWDGGEQALAGWTIYIDSVANGTLDPWEISTVTNADGKYSFTNLGPGEYAIREVNQKGWIQTFPTTPYALNLKIDSFTNGTLDPWELSTVTNADGQYTFSNLGPGQYAIREVNQTGWIQTFPTTPYAVNLKAGEKLTGINFGNYF
ncbi:MAG: SdrD B-like domain-containing protein, partial [Microcystis panniformis]